MHNETILIVDDDPVNLMVLRRLISRKAPYRIIEAIDGQSALDLAQANPDLDLILLDVQMGEISGIDVCRILKNNPRTRAIPIILISAVHTDDASIAEGLDSGADGYITKPVDDNMLQAWLNASMRINALRRALANQAGPALGDLGTLLGFFAGLAHSVNNPLQGIMATGDLLGMEHEGNPEILEAVHAIQSNAEKIARLVEEASQQARAFSAARAST
ncbi:MAG: response regulator [Candidatus Hydrogenedentes bacterium]|nr:response regulator [Candidatus Hydrogenedentota bacterium]